jgi:hypothetical protein
MEKKEEVRIYTMDDATLIQRCDALESSLLRDQADLNYRNVTPAVISDFSSKIDTFRETDTDVEWVGIVSTFVAEKDKVRNELHILASSIRNMAENVYGLGKGLYKTFGFTDLSRLDDNNYVRAAKRIHRVATTLLADLAPEGLDAPTLAALLAKIDDLDGAIDSVHTKEEERDLATQNRIATGNTLYRTASKLAGIGKTHFFSRDEAKYNDYVLLPSAEGEEDPEPPTP